MAKNTNDFDFIRNPIGLAGYLKGELDDPEKVKSVLLTAFTNLERDWRSFSVAFKTFDEYIQHLQEKEK